MTHLQASFELYNRRGDSTIKRYREDKVIINLWRATGMSFLRQLFWSEPPRGLLKEEVALRVVSSWGRSLHEWNEGLQSSVAPSGV